MTTPILQFSNLTTVADTANSSPYTTASVSPKAGSLVFVCCESPNSSYQTPTVSGLGATWTLVESQDFATQNRRLVIYRTQLSADQTGAITITVGGSPTGMLYSVIEVKRAYYDATTGVTPGVGAVVASNNIKGGSDSITGLTLNYPNTFALLANGGFAVFSTDANANITPDGAWSELGDAGNTVPTMRIETQGTASNKTTASATWSSANGYGIAIEVRAGVFSRPTTRNSGNCGVGARRLWQGG